jgi:hypothetical protein
VSREHRRSLVAFALVALACVVVIASGLRSSALQGVLGHPAAHRAASVVVPGSVLDRAPRPRTPAADPPADTPAAVTDPSVRPAEPQAVAPPVTHQAPAHSAQHGGAAPPAGHPAYAAEPWHPGHGHGHGHGHGLTRGHHGPDHAHPHPPTRHFWPHQHR